MGRRLARPRGWTRRTLPPVELRYLYVGSSDVDSDLAGWLLAPGARLRWRFRHFGADVAAVDPGGRPYVLLADHRPPGSVLPIFGVDDLADAVATLEAGAWSPHPGPVGTPEGSARLLRTPGGASVALLQVDRPEAMETAYADEANTHRVLP